MGLVVFRGDAKRVQGLVVFRCGCKVGPGASGGPWGMQRGYGGRCPCVGELVTKRASSSSRRRTTTARAAGATASLATTPSDTTPAATTETSSASKDGKTRTTTA